MILSEFASYKQHGPLFRVWLLEGFVLIACTEENDVTFSLQTKRAIYPMKISFQLNWKLHNILMPLQVESDSCDHSGVGIFSSNETLMFLCFTHINIHIRNCILH